MQSEGQSLSSRDSLTDCRVLQYRARLLCSYSVNWNEHTQTDKTLTPLASSLLVEVFVFDGSPRISPTSPFVSSPAYSDQITLSKPTLVYVAIIYHRQLNRMPIIHKLTTTTTTT
jgi:hypothetical protein